jgi:hypothetical protein
LSLRLRCGGYLLLLLLCRLVGALLIHRGHGGFLDRGGVLEVHRWDEGAGEFLLRYEGVHFRLLGGPALHGVDAEETADEIDKGDAVVHFYRMLAVTRYISGAPSRYAALRFPLLLTPHPVPRAHR